ncbi:MAG: hypothetical protein GWP19_07680, partial [Planctomycetia bacterium]|nr:hypothetical protein [Planctomycetia bacterium]
MKKIILLSFLLTALFAQTIDVDKSYIKFKVRNMGIRDVSGTITDMQGTVKFDSVQPDSAIFDVTVNVNTINTNGKKRDAHLKNEDFFEIEKWPTIHFKSVQIINQDSVYSVTGNLTIKNVTKRIVVPFTIIETDSTITLAGGDIVNRLDYNVGIDYSNFKIGYEISVEVVCV